MGTYDPMPADGALGWGPWLRGAIGGLDARVLAYELGIPIIPSPQYPAVADGVHNAGTLATAGTDDSAIIQQAMADQQGSAIMFAPRTFRVDTMLNRSPDKTKRAARLIGISASNNSDNLTGGPTLLWGGTAGGTLMENRVTGQNIPDGGMEGINLRGYGSQCATLYATGSTTTTAAKPDSGSELERVNFANCTGDALVIDGDGVTMMDLNRVRFDAVKGWAIKIRAVSDVDFGADHVYWDNNSLPGGGTGGGFLYVDGSALGTNATVIISGRVWKLEPQTDLADVDAGATDQADRRGLIRYAINATNQRQQFNLIVDHIRSTTNAARASYSLVLPTGGTAAQRRARLNLQGRNWRGFAGTGVDPTGDWLPLGGVPTADRYNVLAGAIDGHIANVDFRPGGDNVIADEVGKDYSQTAERSRPVAQAIGAAVTSVTAIAHNLAIQPTADDFRFVFTQDPLLSRVCWASAITSTTFTLNCTPAPGGAGTSVAWWFEND